MQEFELSQFLEENRWISGGLILNSDVDNRTVRIDIDISPESHGLIRDHGMQAFEQQIQNRLSSFGLKQDCWKIRPVSPEVWGQSVLGLEHKFPPVLSRIDDSGQQRLLLDVSSEMAWFRGHFPGNPILAGAVQLHWAVGVSLDLFEFREIPFEIKRLKFKSLVAPPRILELALNKTSESEVQFEFNSLGQIHSLGRLIFKEESRC